MTIFVKISKVDGATLEVLTLSPDVHPTASVLLVIENNEVELTPVEVRQLITILTPHAA